MYKQSQLSVFTPVIGSLLGLSSVSQAIHEELSPVTMEAMEPQFLTMDLGVLVSI